MQISSEARVRERRLVQTTCPAPQAGRRRASALCRAQTYFHRHTLCKPMPEPYSNDPKSLQIFIPGHLNRHSHPGDKTSWTRCNQQGNRGNQRKRSNYARPEITFPFFLILRAFVQSINEVKNYFHLIQCSFLIRNVIVQICKTFRMFITY